ncbi:unnamed protein product, partial [Ectocarpus sp. 13 AM-2016]
MLHPTLLTAKGLQSPVADRSPAQHQSTRLQIFLLCPPRAVSNAYCSARSINSRILVYVPASTNLRSRQSRAVPPPSAFFFFFFSFSPLQISAHRSEVPLTPTLQPVVLCQAKDIPEPQ